VHTILYVQLEEQEGALKEDVLDEVVAWGGRILLHKEVEQGVSE
jgi:hypothetical protein